MHDFRSPRYNQERRDHALIAPTVRHHTTLAPDYRGVLTCDVRVDDLTTLQKGATCEIAGEYARFWGGQLVCKSVLVDGERVPVLDVVARLPVVDKGE